MRIFHGIVSDPHNKIINLNIVMVVLLCMQDLYIDVLSHKGFKLNWPWGRRQCLC